MELTKELLEDICNWKSDYELILYTRNNRVLIEELFNLLDEIGYLWRGGRKLSIIQDRDMQYIYIRPCGVTWDITYNPDEKHVFFDYDEVKKFMKHEQEKITNDEILDYMLKKFNLTKDEIVKDMKIDALTSLADSIEHSRNKQCKQKDCNECEFNEGENCTILFTLNYLKENHMLKEE